ncbi:hypothetical protein P9112_005634 [Eukaryota sp. TZLM1-RC]
MSTLKALFLGDECVGKTSIIHKYSRKRFAKKYLPTIGDYYITRKVQCNQQHLLLQIWDTARKPKNRRVGYSHYKNVDVVILVFDLTNRDSFDVLDSWMKEFHEVQGSQRHVPFVVVGNKLDLDHQRCVTNGDVSEWMASHNNMTFYTVSAKENIGVDQLFTVVTEKAIESRGNPSDLYINEPSDCKGCCILL